MEYWDDNKQVRYHNNEAGDSDNRDELSDL